MYFKIPQLQTEADAEGRSPEDSEEVWGNEVLVMEETAIQSKFGFVP